MDQGASPFPPPIAERQSLMSRLRNYFLAGLLVTAPIAITLYVSWWLVNYVDEVVTDLLPNAANPRTHIDIPGVGIVILALFLTLVGFLTANYLGRMALRLSDRAFARMPVIRSFYAAVKQIFETVFSQQTQSFREVVLVEYPRKEMWAVGLVIGQAPQQVRDNTAQDITSVFIPTMSFTSGYLVFVPRRDVIKMDMTVEEALKLVVSGGIVAPPARAPTLVSAPSGSP